MVEAAKFSEEKPRFDKKQLVGDLLYSALKGLGGAALKGFTNLKVNGEHNIPVIGKAILTTVSQNAMRDMLIISNLTGRKVHFMINPKIMKHKVAGPLLKQIGMFRSTINKDDQEPVDKVFEVLNIKGNLVAMTPEAKRDHEVIVKTMAAIIKFAATANCPLIPLVVYTEKTKLFNMIPISGLRVNIGTPIKCEKRLLREKYRAQRYELAEDIIRIVNNLKGNSKDEE